MKLTVNRRILLDKFEVAASCAPKRSSRDVLTNVHVTAKDGSVQLFATDTETGISVDLPCEVHEDGVVLAPRDRLLAILNESQCELAELQATSDALHVQCGKASFTLPVSNPKEYPRASMELSGQTVSLQFDDLHQAVHHTAYATDPDSTRFALGGILVEFNGSGTCDFVASDGRRLSTYAAPCSGKLAQRFIVPAKAMQALCRSKCSGELVIGEWNQSIAVKADGLQFFARQIEGRFPNWQNVIPTTTDWQRCEVGAKEMFSLLRQASITQDTETRGVDLEFLGKAIKASCVTADVGRSLAECACESNIESPVKIKVDSRFMLEYLKATHGDETLTVHVSGPEKPILICCNTHRYVLMPMASS